MERNVRLLLCISVCVVGLTACAEEVTLIERLASADEVDPANPGREPGTSGSFEHPHNEGGPRTGGDHAGSGGGTPPAGPMDPCETSGVRIETFTLTPDAIEGANIVFLIDDSGSMTQEFQKVVWEIQAFVNRILAVTSNNYRIAMIYDHQGDAIRNRAFYRDRVLTDRINDSNPFIDQINSDDVEYFRFETWSKFADIAFARAFMPSSFTQTLPNLIPVDRPFSGSAVLPQNCVGEGRYFRPRDFSSTYGRATLGCYNIPVSPHRIENHLLQGFDVNFVAVSDDDLNVAFDRANFSPTDPNRNAYPEIVDLMFRDLIRPLGDDVRYVYHSIVGPIGSESGATVDKDGVAHLALSKRSGGATYDIRLNDWQPLFSSLTNQIIYSQQNTALQCQPAVTGVEVRFNGQVLDPAVYVVQAADKRVQILPAAFVGYPGGVPIAVAVSYSSDPQ